MSGRIVTHETVATSPRWWRMTVIGLSVLVLCSCQAVTKSKHDGALPVADSPVVDGAVMPAAARALPGGDTLPPSAWTGPIPIEPTQQWAPPGITRPWPRDEYLRDGGDRGYATRVQRDWTIQGLDLEDTIAHYDTRDGRTVIEPSNRVHIYAPRFGAVRRMSGTEAYDSKLSLVQYDVPTRAVTEEERQNATTTLQQQQAQNEIAARRARGQQRDAPSLLAGSAVQLMETQNRFKLIENLLVLSDSVAAQTDYPILADHALAAVTWTRDQGVQVILDDRQAAVATGDAKVQATYSVEPQGKPALRIIKVASTDVAHPGTIVEFLLRFDNIGNEDIGNVTIVDNLTTRLEYVSGSESCSLGGKFITAPNDGDSLVLRWEVTDPLPAGQYGVIRFKCRVR